MSDVIVFDEAEVDPIVGGTRPSTYNSVVEFDESEVEPIVADVVIFDETEVEPIIGTGRTPAYSGVVTFDESEVEPIVADVVIFNEAAVDPIIGGSRGSAYDGVITFDESGGEPILGRLGRVSDPVLAVPADPWALARRLARAAAAPVVTTTGPQDRPSWWPAATNGISFELQEAWLLPAPDGIRTELPLPQTQVLSWLQKHRSQIVAAARRFNVDRRAIAGAIAWEALENARTASIRAVGPGKVHVNADIVNEVEQAGYLPARTWQERAALLKRPEHAIEYIAAIMSAKSAIAEAFGYNMRRRPDLLTNEYVARSLSEWTEHLTNKTDSTLVAAEDMALWTLAHLLYLEQAVGAPGPTAP